MDFKEMAGNIAKGAVNITATAALFAGKGVYEGGKLAKKGIGSACETIAEDRKMITEIKEIDAFCTDTVEAIKQKQFLCERDFNTETARYNAIIARVNRQMQTSDIILSYIEMQHRKERMHFAKRYEAEIDVKADYLGESGSVLAAGGMAGAAAGSAAVGLVTAFGTASTGTAIASLSGAAYTHALLAAMGMGSLASGGFGMAGGMVVLGASFLAPAAAVAGYVANKQIKKVYGEAVTRKKKAAEIIAETELVFEKYTQGINIYRLLNHCCDDFSHHFGEIINIFAAVDFAGDDKAAYKKLLENAAAVMSEFASIGLLDEHGEVNQNLDEEIRRVSRQAEAAKYESYKYIQDASHEKQKFMEEAKDRELLVKDKAELEKVLAAKDKIIEEQQARIALLNQEAMSMKRQIQDIRDADDRAAVLFAGLQKKQEKIISDNKKNFNNYCKYIEKKYRNLDDAAIRFIATGETLYHLYPHIVAEGMDFSPVVLDYAKCVENVTKRLLIRRGIFAEDSPKLSKLCLGSAKLLLEKKCDMMPWGQEFFAIFDEILAYRNKSAHATPVSKMDADKVRVLLLGKSSGVFADGVLLYFNSLLK